MTNILVIWQGRLAGAVAPSTGKIMKNVPEFFEKKAQKKALALKGLIHETSVQYFRTR